MTALTWDENDERLFGSSEKEQSFKRVATFCFLICGFSFLWGLMATCATNSSKPITVFGTIGLILSFIAIGFLIASRQHNGEYNIASQWRESYWQAKKELCELPIEKLNHLCKMFVASGDPKHYKLRYVSRKTQFSCKFTLKDFDRALFDYGRGNFESVLNWSPLIKEEKNKKDVGDKTLVHNWFAEED